MDPQRDIFGPSEGDDLSHVTLTGRDQLFLALATIASLALACGFPKGTDEVSADTASQILNVLDSGAAE